MFARAFLLVKITEQCARENKKPATKIRMTGLQIFWGKWAVAASVCRKRVYSRSRSLQGRKEENHS